MNEGGDGGVSFADGYHELAPPPALRSRIECFWLARGASGPRCVLPDGCVDFLFDAGNAGLGARVVGAGPAVAVALRHGYADQAHFARDVRDLTGSTWSSLRR